MTELLEVVTKTRPYLETGATRTPNSGAVEVAGRVLPLKESANWRVWPRANIRKPGCYNATVKWFDGADRLADHAPYDGRNRPPNPVPSVAHRQLRVGGKLVIPSVMSGSKFSRVIIKTEGRCHTRRSWSLPVC